MTAVHKPMGDVTTSTTSLESLGKTKKTDQYQEPRWQGSVRCLLAGRVSDRLNHPARARQHAIIYMFVTVFKIESKAQLTPGI